MTLLAGYLLFSLSTLTAIAIFITACDELAAELLEAPMPNTPVLSSTTTVRTPAGVPAQPTIVERHRQLFVEFPDGRVVKCHNVATARAVVRLG